MSGGPQVSGDLELGDNLAANQGHLKPPHGDRDYLLLASIGT